MSETKETKDLLSISPEDFIESLKGVSYYMDNYPAQFSPGKTIKGRVYTFDFSKKDEVTITNQEKSKIVINLTTYDTTLDGKEILLSNEKILAFEKSLKPVKDKIEKIKENKKKELSALGEKANLIFKNIYDLSLKCKNPNKNTVIIDNVSFSLTYEGPNNILTIELSSSQKTEDAKKTTVTMTIYDTGDIILITSGEKISFKLDKKLSQPLEPFGSSLESIKNLLNQLEVPIQNLRNF